MKQGWEEGTLGDVTSKIGSGATPRGGKSSYKTAGISLVRSMNVHDFEFREKNLAFIDSEQSNALSNVTLQENDVLLNITGASIARCCLLPKKYLPARVNQHVSIIRAKKNVINPLFLSTLLISKFYKDKILETGEQGATRQAITKAQLEDFKIIYPKSLPEQKRIVSVLDKAFTAIAKAKANAEQNLKNAKELFESYLQGVFENKGEGWEEKKLGEICKKITDGVHKKPTYVPEGVPFIKINNLTESSGIAFSDVSYITREDHELFCKRTKPEKGDILITKDGTIGVVRVIETDIEFSIFVSVALIKPISNEITPYLKYVLISPLIQDQIKPKGAALKHLYLKDLRCFNIPIAPLIEQQTIVKKLDALSAETKKLEVVYQQKIQDLEELKKSILQKAFNGELTEKKIAV